MYIYYFMAGADGIYNNILFDPPLDEDADGPGRIYRMLTLWS